MFRVPRALIPYLLLAAALAGGLLWHQSRQLSAAGHVTGTGVAAIGGPFTLTDQNGKRVSDRDFRGSPMLVYFGYSMCPDVCPTTLAVMAEALEALGPAGAHIVPVFITIDPERDTPKILGPYMKAFGPRFVGLTGSVAEIAAVEKAYKVYAKKQPLEDGKAGYGMDHSSVMYLMGPDGTLVSYYDDLISPQALEKELREKAAP